MSAFPRYPRPSALDKLGPGLNIVEASAGTGKTFLLEHFFVDLILTHGLSGREILVVTFTEKATAELVVRLRKLVTDLVNLRADLGSEHGPDRGDARAAARDNEVWVIDDRARRLLGETLLGFDQISISTIHGFCQRVLGEHAFAQGRLFDETLVGADAAFTQAFHEVMRTEVARETDLSSALEAWLASGRSIADLRKLLLACDQLDAAEIRPRFDRAGLASAFKAFADFAPGLDLARVEKQLKAAKVHASTIRAVRNRLSAIRAVLDANPSDAIRFLAGMQALGGEFSDPPVLDYILSRVAQAEGQADIAALASVLRGLATTLTPLEVVLLDGLFARVRERARARKRVAGQFDFTDQLKLIASALADHGPRGRALLEGLRGRYRHALIDEFQDTDETQWSIFRRLFVDENDRHGKRGLTVIGDPKQAIYGFRGADVRTYLAAGASLRELGAGQLPLRRNFRSSPDILAAYNLVFDENAQGTPFFRPASGIDYGHPVTCGRPDLALLDAGGNPLAPVVLFSLEDGAGAFGAREARLALQDAIVSELRSLLALDGPRRSAVRDHGREEKKLEARGIFILTFTNGESRDIGHALTAAGIAHAFYKQGDLFASSEAEEILAVLRAIAAPEDRGLRAKAFLTRFFDLDLAATASCLDRGDQSAPHRLLLDLAALADRGDIPRLMSEMVDATGILRRELFAGAGERGLTNLMHMLELLQAHWTATRASLPELGDLLEAWIRGTQEPPGRESDLQRLETDRDAVQILTVHKAKGLEADVVFLYGGTGQRGGESLHVLHEDGRRVLYVGQLSPDEQRRVNEESADERSRLLYVALTRARYRLYLPLFPASWKRLNGPYARLNQRLDQIVAQDEEPARRLFQRERVELGDGNRARQPEREEISIGRPSERNTALSNLLSTGDPQDGNPVVAEVAAIRDQRSGFVVTSYTAVKRAQSGGQAPHDEAHPGTDEHRTPHEQDGDELPGGAETGVFLHEILALVSLPELARGPRFEDWFAQPRVTELLERLGRRHARPAAQLMPAARLVHTAFTAPTFLGEEPAVRLAAVSATAREMEFLFPIPETSHALFSSTDAGLNARGFSIERGVVKGFVDFLFEEQGRVYICDWKSDQLSSFDAASLARHCQKHYDIQACLYTLAALRMVGVTRETFARRFGGMVFCFLRGRTHDNPQAGVHFTRPTWDDILAWENAMRGTRFWGLPE